MLYPNGDQRLNLASQSLTIYCGHALVLLGTLLFCPHSYYTSRNEGSLTNGRQSRQRRQRGEIVQSARTTRMKTMTSPTRIILLPLSNEAVTSRTPQRVMKRRSGTHETELPPNVSSSQESSVYEEPYGLVMQGLKDAMNLYRSMISHRRHVLASGVPTQPLSRSVVKAVRNGA
ncbi:hypothetical protein BC939DRAFT_102617 [Gamsiella multidivaricata]|uniref:uncharacterized protein n=1 Tax=Gamsiella multidivaricata TaxID=101098 RepID=UPI00221F66AD|nr:uncharacterized protein BC939DRAFT_102617 [Gamsiella multidivaricata]KAI7832388.1 hypothetical protein BC939DRAFT_102617 [Gamsiella multidivaricata]